MNPLELVAKTLYAWNEKDLSCQVLNAFGQKAQTYQQFDEIAKCFFELKIFNKAIEFGEHALKQAKTKEEKYVTTKNLINAYNQYNYPEKAITQLDKCKKLYQLDEELLLEETFSYSAINQKDKSEKLLFNLLRHKLSEEIERKAYHNLSGHYFRKDDLHTGLQHFLRAGEIEAYKNKKKIDYEKWDGTITPGRTIIIDSECGAGDEIMHVRFMKHLRDVGMKPIWTSTRKDLVRLFNHNGFDAVCVWDNPKFPKDACWVYALALPYYLNLTVHDLGREPYLQPLPEKKNRYSYLQDNKKRKIGIFWDSKSTFDQAHFRSIDFFDLWNVVAKPEHLLYSLQMSDTPVPNSCKNHIQEFHTKDRDFTDTCSIINQMDLVITSCTSIAHIAAAIGKQVCVFVPIMEYYVWTSSTGKSWWYGDHVHLFKQTKPRVWDEPLNQLKEFLQ